MNNFLLLILFLVCKTSLAAATDTLRCKNKLIMKGDTTYEVKKKCGPPTSEESIGFIKVYNEYVNVTQYVYDFGHGKLLKILEFRNGKLYRISDGPRI